MLTTILLYQIILNLLYTSVHSFHLIFYTLFYTLFIHKFFFIYWIFYKRCDNKISIHVFMLHPETLAMEIGKGRIYLIALKSFNADIYVVGSCCRSTVSCNCCSND